MSLVQHLAEALRPLAGSAGLNACEHLAASAGTIALRMPAHQLALPGEGDVAFDHAGATWRLAEGAAWFERNGWPLKGFVAPAWLLGPGAWQALRQPGPGAPRFSYTSTLRALHPLQQGKPQLASRGVVYSHSTAWRRAASVTWAAINQATLSQAPVLRLELHPADGRHRTIRRSWQRALEAGLRTRQAATVAECLARYTATAGLPDGARRRSKRAWTSSHCAAAAASTACARIKARAL
eukprot:gene36090-48575_t